MATEAGEDFVLNVNTGTVAVPVWTPVAGMDSWSGSFPKDRQEYPVFGGAPLSKAGRRGHDYQVSGYYDPTDPGQQALRDAAVSDDVVQVQVLPDGNAGWEQDVKVGTTSHDAEADPTSLQETAFEFTGVADPASVNGGELP